MSNANVSECEANNGGGIENQGTLTLSNITLSSNGTNNFGGAIDNTGTLTVNDSTLTSNSAGNSGGAISSEGMLTVNNSTFSGNYAGEFRRRHRQLFRPGHDHRRLLHRQ